MKNVFRALIICLVISGITLLLPACGGGSDKIKVAFITNNPEEFWNYAEAGCIKAGQEVNVEPIVKRADGTAESQKRIIEDLKVKGVKAFAVSPNNVKDNLEFFRELNKTHPLILVDSDVSDDDPKNYEVRRCYLGTNNIEAGKAAGELLMKARPDGGDFVIYVGQLDVLNAGQRREGVVTQLAGGKVTQEQMDKLQKGEYPIKFGKFTLLNTFTDQAKREIALTKVEDTLKNDTYKNLTGMVGLWAYNPPAMLKAVKAAKRLDKIALVGFDEDQETLEGIKNEEIEGTIVQNPFQFGRMATLILASLAKGEDSILGKGDYKCDEEQAKRIYVKHRVIPKDMSVENFRAELKKNLSYRK